MIRPLVFAFDCEDGQDENIFQATLNLIGALMGTDAMRVFSHYVDATDGRYYLKENFAPACWQDMCNAAARQED